MQHAMDAEDELERSLRPAEEGGTELEAEAKEGELEEGGTELEEGELVEEGELAGQQSWRLRRESWRGQCSTQWTQRTSWRSQCSAVSTLHD